MHFKANNTEKELEDFSKFIEENCPVSDTMKNGSKLVNTGIVKE